MLDCNDVYCFQTSQRASPPFHAVPTEQQAEERYSGQTRDAVSRESSEPYQSQGQLHIQQ